MIVNSAWGTILFYSYISKEVLNVVKVNFVTIYASIILCLINICIYDVIMTRAIIPIIYKHIKILCS